MPVDISLVKSQPFFEGLSEEDLGELASVMQIKSVKPGEMLAHAGETLNYLVFVESGCLQVHEISEDGRVIGIGTLHAGEALGWLPLIDGLPLTCSVNASEASQLLLLPMAVAQRMALSRALFTERLLKLLAKSVRHSMSEKSMLSLPNAFHRVIVQINQLSEANRKSDGENASVSNLPKQHELASIVNTSRETVSRTLQLLIKNGILTKAGHNILIKQSDLLNKLATEGPEALRLLKK